MGSIVGWISGCIVVVLGRRGKQYSGMDRVMTVEEGVSGNSDGRLMQGRPGHRVSCLSKA